MRPGATGRTLHERIRRHSQAAAAVVKEQGGRNDLMARLAADPAFGRVDFGRRARTAAVYRPRPQQVDEFLAEVVDPLLSRYPAAARGDAEVRV